MVAVTCEQARELAVRVGGGRDQQSPCKSPGVGVCLSNCQGPMWQAQVGERVTEY